MSPLRGSRKCQERGITDLYVRVRLGDFDLVLEVHWAVTFDVDRLKDNITDLLECRYRPPSSACPCLLGWGKSRPSSC